MPTAITHHLNEKIAKANDSGLFLFRRNPNKFPLTLSGFSLTEALHSEDPQQLIQAIPPQKLYMSIMQQGAIDSLEVLELISKDQFQRICDYEVWDEDSFLPKKLLTWIDLMQEISTDLAFSRFKELDYEYQISCLAKHVKVFTHDEQLGLSPQQKEDLVALPGNELFYLIENSDPDLRKSLTQLLEACLEHDIQYTISLLLESAYSIPLEIEHLSYQFRKARLEEDGFVDYQEAMEIFYPYDITWITNKWNSLQQPPQADGIEPKHPSAQFLFQQVFNKIGAELPQFSEGLLYLSNSLCAVTGIEADNLTGLKSILEHIQSLINLGLEFLSQQDNDLAEKILKTEYPKDLFRVGLQLIRQIQSPLVEYFRDQHPKGKQLHLHWQMNQFHQIHDWFDRQVGELGYQETELLKAFFNRFPLVGHTRGDTLEFQPIATLNDLHLVRQHFEAVTTAKS